MFGIAAGATSITRQTKTASRHVHHSLVDIDEASLLTLQVNRYSAIYGLKYGAFGDYRHTWFVHFPRPNEVLVDGPYKLDCLAPTLLQVGTELQVFFEAYRCVPAACSHLHAG